MCCIYSNVRRSTSRSVTPEPALGGNHSMDIDIDLPVQPEPRMDQDHNPPQPEPRLDEGNNLQQEVPSSEEEDNSSGDEHEQQVPMDNRMAADDDEGDEDGYEDPDIPFDLGETSIEELEAQKVFIEMLRGAKLENSGLTAAQLRRLRDPPHESLEITDPVLGRSLQLWLHLDKVANTYYEGVRKTMAMWEPAVELLPLHEVKKKAEGLSGVVPLYTDMCEDGCVAFTGPWANADTCPKCGKSRYNTTKAKPRPVKRMVTFPVGPQIQAAWSSPECAEAMKYRARATQEILDSIGEDGECNLPTYSDIIHSTEYLKLCDGDDDERVIKSTDTLLMFSIDGAQLYRMKQSECWIYIWVLLDRSPDTRYKNKHVLIGGIVPGPNHPKHVESFLFPGFSHVIALMDEGLTIWDASTNVVFISKIFIPWFTADTIGMTPISGLVGHHGKHGCRLYCLAPGRHKAGAGGHYYPAMKKPIGDYTVRGSLHDDVGLAQVVGTPSTEWTARYYANLTLVQRFRNHTQYELNQRETGIKKPSILLAFPPRRIFPFPLCIPGDIMHMGINTFDLMTNLWRGTMVCTAPDNVDTWNWAVLRDNATWSDHGKAAAAVLRYLPISFDCPPRNIAEKINSGYKAMEMSTYLFGLSPALLYGLLPLPYWRNLCKLVRGIRLMSQHNISKEELAEGHKLLLEFCEEFEDLYYQRNPKRLHFCRQAIHNLAHMATETKKTGPYAVKSQWTMERIIGDLGDQIRQDSNPHNNLMQRGLRRAQVNAIKHMLPAIDPDLLKTVSSPGAQDVGSGYVLLCFTEKPRYFLPGAQRRVMQEFAARTSEVDTTAAWREKPHIKRWARLRLPNGQIARSWKEVENVPVSGALRTSRNVKVSTSHKYILN